MTNKEISEDLLVSRVRRWAASSERLQAGTFDMLQIAESADGRFVPRAICGILRTKLLLADGAEPVKSLVTVFYRARDYLNREFWEDQARRLSDILADEYLGGDRGVHLMVHHNAPAWPLGLEIGDHRLLADLETLDLVGNPLAFGRGSSAQPELLEDPGACEAAGHRSFHRLCAPAAGAVAEAGGAEPAGAVKCGHYVLRDGAGEAVCGLEVLGTLPTRLVCGAVWAAAGREADFGALLHALRQRSGRPMCSVLADPRDASWQRLCGRTAQSLPGLWHSRKRLGVAVTGTPVGLQPEEQVRLAQAPFLVPWEFVPFHFGRLVLI